MFAFERKENRKKIKLSVPLRLIIALTATGMYIQFVQNFIDISLLLRLALIGFDHFMHAYGVLYGK